jgi:hypothetical protein
MHMTPRIRILFAAAAVAALLAPAAPHLARADAAQQQNFAAWSQMSNCARQAAVKFPDHTPQGNAQREAARQECLRRNHLPVTAAPPPAQSGQ